MATAEELLATVGNEQNYIVIDSDLRTMTFPASVKNIGVENDKGVHKLNFMMPRYFSEYDLSTFNIRINYLNAQGDGDMYVVTEPTVEEDAIYFTWLVGRHACLYKGTVTFIVCLKLADGEGDVAQEFNTTLASLQVLPGLETEPAILENDYDIIEQLLLTIQDTNDKIKAVLDSGLTPEEITDFVTESKTLSARMDEFTKLPDGSTAGDAELTDIRVGADGTVYNNAGDAVRGQVTGLKSAIDDITETVQSTNIFNQANATITEGKYLNPNTGNEGTNADYCYVNEYIPVEENTQYYGTTWNKTSGQLLGSYIGFVIFYDANKAYIGGLSGSSTQNPFTTPAGCAYMRISQSIKGHNASNCMFEKGTTPSAQFVPYSVTHKLKLPLSIVDINGNGDFTSIASAVNTLPDGSAILVMPGTYEENVKAWSKEIHIIGIDREACILKDVSGNYSTPPLEIGAGSVQNMTIIEQAEGAGTENMAAYAIHVESNNLFNKQLLIRNCYIYSDSSSAIGMGLRGGCSVRIEDCEIICAGARASTGASPLYFHDADAQAYWGVANLYLHNNVLRNTASTLFSMLTINSIHAENTTYMHMMYNIFVRSKTPALSQKFNVWNTAGNTDADGWNGLSHMYLEDDSFGNNLSELNYSV